MRKITLLLPVLALIGIFITLGCEKEILLPAVTTAEVTNVFQSGATCGGEVTSDGNDTVYRGVCYGGAEMPTISDSKTENGTGVGVFTSQITGLAPGVKYYVRAYATNSKGTVYGAQKEFTTPL
ncbi:MAG TPA: hypothetical protein P5228_12510 [Bacteroidales bacterium]|nr:hypothetical protein [Bacteroidales bacterium]HRZ48127.1 hypothetical protein [Bacteroidales bacterium]